MTIARTVGAITADDISKMSYNQLIGLTKETNRPPGGIATLRRVAQATFLRPGHSVLEIGTSTGFTAIELARMTGAHVSGIDINPMSLDEARARAERFQVTELASFQQADATALRLPDDSFDLVFCGNVTSLVSHREKALREYRRVLKRGKYLAAVPMYYMKEPPTDLVRRVSDAIQVQITPHYRNYWLKFFVSDGLEPFLVEDYQFDDISSARIDDFTDKILASAHLNDLDGSSRGILARRYREYMHIFRDNLAQMGFTIILLRKEDNPMDEELFTAIKCEQSEYVEP